MSTTPKQSPQGASEGNTVSAPASNKHVGTPSSKQTKGQLLLADFLRKLDKSLGLISSKKVITLEEMRPAWDARDKLEAYLAPPRDSKGHFLKAETALIDLQPSDLKATTEYDKAPKSSPDTGEIT